MKDDFITQLLSDVSPGYLKFGNTRMAFMDVEAGFWSLRRQMEILLGSNMAGKIFQQAGANGGASYAAARWSRFYSKAEMTMNTKLMQALLLRLIRKMGRIMLTIISIFLAAIIILTAALLVVSPGKPEPFLDENGSILAGSLSEKIFVDVNGVKQGMFIKSKNTQNPVLLFVHGGPGMPEYWLTQRYPTGLENHFTVVWWEQRGAGLSYHPDLPSESMPVEQFVADTLEVTRYLIKRFGQEKIYLLGHSWGSYIGIQAAARAPELYFAYIGRAGFVSTSIRTTGV